MDIARFSKYGDQLPDLEFLGHRYKVVLALVSERELPLSSVSAAVVKADLEQNRLLTGALTGFGEA